MPLLIPRDDNDAIIQLVPRVAALARTLDTTISSATSVTLNVATTLIEVTALTQGIYMRYSAGASSSNFDEFIPANSTRHYVKPSGVTVVSFLEVAASATLIVIEK